MSAKTVTGRVGASAGFTADPVPGGSAGPYLYPTNPITAFDLDGMSWVRTALRRASTVAGLVAFGACVVATVGVCGAATIAAIGACGLWNTYRYSHREISGRRAVFNVGIDATSRWARPVRSLKWARPATRLHGVRAERRLHPLWKHTTSPSVRLNLRFHPYRTVRRAGVQSYYGYRSARNGW